MIRWPLVVTFTRYSRMHERLTHVNEVMQRAVTEARTQRAESLRDEAKTRRDRDHWEAEARRLAQRTLDLENEAAALEERCRQLTTANEAAEAALLQAAFGKRPSAVKATAKRRNARGEK